MKLGEYLLHKTNVGTLVHIKKSGYNVGCTYIDYEDLFIGSLSKNVLDKEVEESKWDYIEHTTEHGDKVISPCLVISIK